MSPFDAAAFGAPLLAGATLLGLFLRRKALAGSFCGARSRVSVLHARATAALVRRGILRFPGIALVDPGKSWVAGEAVFLAAAAMLLPMSRTAAGALLAVLAALLPGGATVCLSLRDASARQIDAVRRSLPAASFLLSLLLEAGLGSHAALREVVVALPAGPLPRELEEIARSRSLGIPREEAIERSRERVPLDEFRLFLNLVQQGEQLGVGLSHGLRELSSRMMETQEHRAEALAQKAAVKLLLPLVVFIFPAVFLVILSPVILSLVELWGNR